MAKREKKPLKAAQWFGIADQFIRGAQTLGGYHEQTGDGSQVLPDLTCRAFATEAYLKCLLTIRRRAFPNIHDLKQLFELLLPADQKYIRSEWDEHSLPIILGAANAGFPRNVPVVRDFHGALLHSKDAFVEWRYETNLGATWYLLHFPFFVRERVLQSKPKWVSSPPDFFGKFPKPHLGKQNKG